MKYLRSIAVALLLASLLPFACGQQGRSEAYSSAARKIAWLAENGRSVIPSRRPTVLTAEEWNAYLNEGGVRLPDSLSNIRITCDPALVHGNADVDFDRLTANRTRGNPLLALFTGKHHVTVNARAAAASGQGSLRVDSVLFDGVEVPRIALQYFASRYLQPKYGKAVGMDATIPLPARIDAAMIGVNQVTITQR